MFDTILKNSTGMEMKLVLLLMGIALLLGILLAIVYRLTDKSGTKNFLTALVVLPPMVCAVISLVNRSLGTGIAIAGAFTLVRFRSQQGNAKEIAVLFLDMAIGLAAASGYVFFTCIFAVGMMLVLIVLSVLNFGARPEREKQLKITMAESVDYEEAFNEIFGQYTESVTVDSVKTSNKDTVLEVKYITVLKKDADTKAFLKAISEVNDYLPVSLSAVVKKPNGEL